jgi:hypothetical protein
MILIVTLLIFACIWIVVVTRSNSGSMVEFGFQLPPDAKVSVFGRESGPSTEVIYAKIQMQTNSWRSMFANPPFAGMPASITSNPFLEIKKSFVNWEPQKLKQGIGGLINIGSNRTVMYFFELPKDGIVTGYLMVGIQN